MANPQSEQDRRLQQRGIQSDLGTGSQPTHLDLFSGIGGFALAAKWAGFRTIAFCEIDKYCQKILAKNFGAETVGNSREQSARREIRGSGAGKQGVISDNGQTDSRTGLELPSKIVPNIFDFDGTAYRGCDLLTGGFPCQPFSVAGKRRGAADDRAIWPEMFRVIKEARPAWVLGENVPGIIPMELDNVLSDLESIGYAVAPPFVIPACAVDAKHRRDRLWIIGRRLIEFIPDADEQGSQGRNGAELRECAGERIIGASGSSVCNTAESGLQNGSILSVGATGGLQPEFKRSSSDCCKWEPEPDVGRVAHGIPKRVDRLKGLGNAIVPSVAYEILREIRNLIP